MARTKTPQQAREDALRKAIAKAKIELGMEYDKDVAEMLGVCRGTFCSQQRKNFEPMKLWGFAKMARMLHFSGKDVCAIIGVPMDGD